MPENENTVNDISVHVDNERIEAIFAVPKSQVTQHVDFSQGNAKGGGVVHELHNIRNKENPSIKDLKYKKLIKVCIRFNGLCEIISNHVILNDLLGQPQVIELYSLQKNVLKQRNAIAQINIKINEASERIQNNKNSKEYVKVLKRIQSLHTNLQIANAQLKLLEAEFVEKNNAFKMQNGNYTKDNFNIAYDKNNQSLSLTQTLQYSPLEKQITLKKLRKLENSHIMYVASFIQILKAYFFNIYPHSLFSAFESAVNKEKENLNGKEYPTIARASLGNKLNTLEVNSYIKFFVFKKSFCSLQGHSMVIKKTSADGYSFFDPNTGEAYNLSIDALCEKLDKAIFQYSGTHVAFIDAKKYINDLTAAQKGQSKKP